MSLPAADALGIIQGITKVLRGLTQVPENVCLCVFVCMFTSGVSFQVWVIHAYICRALRHMSLRCPVFQHKPGKGLMQITNHEQPSTAV